MNFFAILLRTADSKKNNLSHLKNCVTGWSQTVDSRLSTNDIVFIEFPWGNIAYSKNCHFIRRKEDGATTVVAGQPLPRGLSTSFENLADGANVTADGFFVYANCHANSVTVSTDALSMCPLYVNDLQSPTVFSNYSTLAGCLLGKFDSNHSAILDYATKDSLLENDSFVAGIHRACRGSVYSTNQTGVSSRRINDNLKLPRNDIDFKEAVGEFSESVINYAADHSVLLGLTGGLDSRIPLAALLRNKSSFLAATHNHPCKDSDISKALSDRFSFQIQLIPKTSKTVHQGLAMFAKRQLQSEGLALPTSWEFGKSVNDLAADEDFLHIGGLGGEVTRGYWDDGAAGFNSFREAISTRFFSPRTEAFFPANTSNEERKNKWLSSPEIDSPVDEFASLHIAYLDRRLRAVIASRSNSLDCSFAWPLANSKLYQYSMRLPRADRQAPTTLTKLIEEMYPQLLDAPLHRGSAGKHSKGWYASTKRAFSGTPVARYVMGKLKPTSRAWIFDMLFSEQCHAFLSDFVSSKGIRLLKTRHGTFDRIAEKLLAGFIFERRLKNLEENIFQIENGKPANPANHDDVANDLLKCISNDSLRETD